MPKKRREEMPPETLIEELVEKKFREDCVEIYTISKKIIAIITVIASLIGGAVTSASQWLNRSPAVVQKTVLNRERFAGINERLSQVERKLESFGEVKAKLDLLIERSK